MLQFVSKVLKKLHAKLSFDGWEHSPQFSTRKSLGRNALLALSLGIVLGVHLTLILALSIPGFLNWSEAGIDHHRLLLLRQWCAYMISICTFHLLEFFVTALFNPTEVTSDSFLVNHSPSYIGAVLSSWLEFVAHFFLFPNWNLPRSVILFGAVMVAASQLARSSAMATAGASFNHIIQTSKKENHVLITHGIYSVLRHPSYVGFYYWSIATQVLLGNALHAILFAVVSWSFFRKRIPYEEESLCKLFPVDYPNYVRRTWIGIPFLWTDSKQA